MWHKHGLEVVSWVLSLTVEFIDWEVTWKFLSEGATHSLQLFLHLAPKALYGVSMGPSCRMHEVFVSNSP